MKNRLLIPLIVVSVVGLIIGSSLGSVLILKQKKFDSLSSDFETLLNEFEELVEDYEIIMDENVDYQQDLIDLQIQYENLGNDYNILSSIYQQLQEVCENLENELLALVTLIKSLPLLDKMTFFYHCCRMNFDPWYDSSLIFARDLILHGSIQYNGFQDVETMFDDYDFWEFGNSMMDYEVTMNSCLGDWVQGLYNSYYEEDIFNWITSNIDYRYDSETSYNRNYPIDLYLSSLETLKYRCGDCDDFAILGGTFFELKGYNVKFATIHDSIYYPSELHHAWLWVNVGWDRWLSNSITNPIWSFNGGITYEWMIVDLTPYWQQSIWFEPAWFTWYENNGITPSMWLSLENSIYCDPPPF